MLVYSILSIIMSHQGAALQSYNNELVKCIEDLCSKRDELHRHILNEEEEKQKLQSDIRTLTERLAKVNESIAKKMTARNEFDKTISETEAAYMKILETSQTLLNSVKGSITHIEGGKRHEHQV